MSDISIRAATSSDFGILVDFRLRMFRDMGWTDEERLSVLAPLYLTYLEKHFSAGDFLAWIAEDADGEVVGSVGLLWEQVPPTVRNLHGRQAYVLALYVIPERRRRGVARALASEAVRYAEDEGADVIALHASEEGRRLYDGMGFVDSPEMRLFTDPGSAAWSPTPHIEAEDVD